VFYPAHGNDHAELDTLIRHLRSGVDSRRAAGPAVTVIPAAGVDVHSGTSFPGWVRRSNAAQRARIDQREE
jgi:hypothetical protein